MRQRINLFRKKKAQQPIPVVAHTIRTYSILVACISFVLAVIAGGGYLYQTRRLEDIQADIRRLEQRTRSDQEIKGEIVFFINKKEQLKEFLADDARFAQYYYLLQDTLRGASTDAKLRTFDINTRRDVNFEIMFTDFENSQQLLDFIEHDAFLDNFEFLNLNSFSVTERVRRDGNNFVLSFTGRFAKPKNVRTTKKN